jgi:hypothetical protein
MKRYDIARELGVDPTTISRYSLVFRLVVDDAIRFVTQKDVAAKAESKACVDPIVTDNERQQLLQNNKGDQESENSSTINQVF